MHDIKTIRDETDVFVAGLKRRGISDASDLAARILARDKELRDLLTALQQKQARRNEASKLIGQAKAKKDEVHAAALMAEVAGLKDDIQAGEQKERELSEALKNEIAGIPNLPASDVPDGADENDNKPIEARYFKSGRAAAGGMNAPKEHFDLGEKLGMMDFERAAKVSGARFVYLKGALARVNRALASFMLDSHTTKFGYEEVVPPMLVKDQAMFGTGQLPKFHDDQFAAYQEPDLKAKFANIGEGAQDAFELGDPTRFWLVPTAEVPLTNYVREEVLAEAELPLRFTAFTPCFRAEAGAAGKDTRGMIRMHQFDKVELVSIAHPDYSEDEHERMTACAEEVLKRLGVGDRVMLR
jgi:seryl-tRNA synthetase